MSITHGFVSGKADGADPTLVQPSNWNAVHVVDPATITRSMLAADAVQWQFLGRQVVNVAASNTGTLVLTAARKHLQIRAWIAGYSGSGGIASLQLGGAAIDTGSNYCSSLLEGATLTTSSVSTTGMRVAASAITGPRFLTLDLTCWGSTIVKRILGRANSNSVSAATVPTQTQIAGLWVNTTDVVQRIQFTAFSGLTGTGTVNFNTGTEFEVWGRDDE